MDDYSENAVVIDIGHTFCRAGLATDDSPKELFPPVVGRPDKYPEGIRSVRALHDRIKYPDAQLHKIGDEVLVGYKAISKAAVLTVRHPIERRIVTNWDDMTEVWKHTFTSLGIPPTEHGVLLSEAPLAPRDNRTKKTEIMFEEMDVPKFYLGVQQALALYACGRTTAMVIDSGYGVTDVVPVYDGYALPHAAARLNYGGSYLSNYLSINESEHHKTRVEKESCYVALDYEAEMKLKGKDGWHTLPDGEKVPYGHKWFEGPEAMFQPIMLNAILKHSEPIDAIHDTLFRSIMKCDLDIRKDLFERIVLCGGNTLLRGFPERLKYELTKLAPAAMPVNIVAPEERINLVWIGSSILAGLSSFQEMWITRDEYCEIGPEIVRRKCF